LAKKTARKAKKPSLLASALGSSAALPRQSGPKRGKGGWASKAWEATVEFTAERKDELSGFLGCSAAMLAFLALIPRDPNLLGPLGSALQRLMIGAFGLGAFLVVGLVVAWGWVKMLKRSVHAPWVKALGWSLILLSLVSLLNLVFDEKVEAGPYEGLYLSGLLGRAYGGLLLSYTAPVGVVILAMVLAGVALYLLEQEGLVKNFFLQLYERSKIKWLLRASEEGREAAAAQPSAEDDAERLREIAEKAVKKLRKGKAEILEAAPPAGEDPVKSSGGSAQAGAAGEDSLQLMDAAGRDKAAELFLKRRQEIKVSALGPRVNTSASTDSIGSEDAAAQPRTNLENYQMPPVSLLKHIEGSVAAPKDYQEVSSSLERSLASFGVGAKVVEVCPGPSVTRYEIALAPGVKMSRVVTLADDIALSAKVSSVRIEGPIPGKGTLGIEIPNLKASPVSMRELIETEEFKNSAHKLIFAVGKDIGGSMIFANLAEMPHLMVAGTTGSGKSVCLNGIITSILFRAAPDEVKFLMVDPKRVELTPYDGIPHLMRPVVTNPKEAAGALRLMVETMEERYKTLAKAGMRKIDDYNEWVDSREKEKEAAPEMSAEELAAIPKEPPIERLPYIVVIVDELADLMMVSANEVESSIARLAQMARGVGIHLVIATQRPSVDVITGVIKANFPSRIAFQVSSKVDSRTILDASGADALLGKGDMLYNPFNVSKPVRVQGCFLSSSEVAKVVAHVKNQADPVFDPRFQNLGAAAEGDEGLKNGDFSDVDDAIYEDAVRAVLRMGQGSTSVLQRRLRIGYGKAARLLDKMEAEGIIGPPDGNRPRKVLINPADYADASPLQAEMIAEEADA
jgi:S-DNA-T family DNA segregation ATPase FtsK/SpoIIIE